MRIEHLLWHLGRAALYGMASWALTCPLSGQAATTMVTVENFDFNPSAVTINVNDSVQWNWGGGFHNTTSNVGDTTMWASPSQFSGTFTVPFPAAGSFPYTCTVHGFPGTVTVNGGNNPPTVSITSPTNGATFIAPWTGTIQVSASDSDGTVTNVDFYAGVTLLGSVANPSATPNFNVTSLAANTYALTALATDNTGAATTSTAVNINVVTPVPIVLSAPQRVSASSFQFSYSANIGLSYMVLRAGHLPGLLPISTNTAASSTVNFLDTNATGAANYYEVQLAPNP
jgi:plastocyanin